MNRSITPTKHTVNALINFSVWLTEKMQETNITDEKLAAHIDMDRKTICRYRHNQQVPRLDVVAAIFAYFGEPDIHISLLSDPEKV